MAIKEWSAGEQVDADDLNNNFAQTLQIQNYTAGETIVAGQAVYLKASDGKVWLADADAEESLNNFVGIAIDGGNADGTIGVQTEGLVTGLSGLTAGTFYYVSSTAGGLSTTESSRKIGLAITTTSLLLKKNETRPVNIQTFTSNDTWTKPLNAKKVLIQLWGGGGAGGGCSSSGNNGGGGGGGGDYFEAIVDADDLTATVAITIGAGGTGGPRTGAGYGEPGDASSFGSYFTAYGGGGGGEATGTVDAAGGGGGGFYAVGGNANGDSSAGTGGGPGGGAADTDSSTRDGGGGGSSGYNNLAGKAIYGGGGGGFGRNSTQAGGAGGASTFGGAGGGGGSSGVTGGTGGAGGVSAFGGNGGAGGTNANGSNGATPAGGGGGAGGSSAAHDGGSGGSGQAVITTYF